jgi:hypothetical protein
VGGLATLKKGETTNNSLKAIDVGALNTQNFCPHRPEEDMVINLNQLEIAQDERP